MAKLNLPTRLIDVRKPEEFPAGSLIFAAYIEHQPDDLQWGIRVGDDKAYFALTSWFGGHTAVGDVSDMYPRNVNLYGIDAAAVSLEVLLDISRRTDPWPGHSPKQGGQLALGENGVRLRALEGSGERFGRRLRSIDVRTWGVVEAEENYQHWIDAWQLRVDLDGCETQVIEIDAALDLKPSRA